MSSDQDLINLYSKRILALAADMPRTTRLDNPDISIKKRAPLCGSTVTIDLDLNNGIVSNYAHDVKACALGQAAAAIVGDAIVGTRIDQVLTARNQLHSMLKENGPCPDAPFDTLKVLEPAREFKNRHASILLCLDAAVDGIEQLENAHVG